VDKPVQLRQVVVLPADESTLFVLNGTRCIEIAGVGAFRPATAWEMISSGRDVREIAAALSCPTDSVEHFIAQLSEADLIVEGVLPATTNSNAAITKITAASYMWKRHALLHPVFRYLADATPRPALLLGLITEICHYTRAVPEIAQTAAGSCRNVDARRIMEHYATEERLHYLDIATGLAAVLGVSRDEVLASRPTPSTIGLLALLDQLARRPDGAFAAVLCFLELDGVMGQRVSSDFTTLAAVNSVDPEAVLPVARHAAADGELEHGDILARELPETVDRLQLDTILNAVHDVKHGFDAVYDELVTKWLEAGSSYRLRGAIVSSRVAGL
jgi:pyrroloquinoline quinone (PQQ) biosynthesis protein C